LLKDKKRKGKKKRNQKSRFWQDNNQQHRKDGKIIIRMSGYRSID
jgi:LAS superfamily LD-carboxypeptidase LdcB